MNGIENQERPYFVESIPDAVPSSSPSRFGLYRLVGLRRQVHERKGREATIRAKIEPPQPDAPFITLGRA